MKKIVFLTGTRADFGKIKSLIEVTRKSKKYEVHIFVTGMHMNAKYGKTVDEIVKCGYPNIFMCYNHSDYDSMDIILSKTISGFSQYIKDIGPDLIVVHGDRVEALAGAIVGSLNNILTAHIEGGELSGTVDELIRHSITKMCHIHFVSNKIARKRLIQMGENTGSIFEIGSPDIDIIRSKKLPDIGFVKRYYEIKFSDYGILVFHPVTTEFDAIADQAKKLVDAVLESGRNYIVIYPNNDIGSDFIFHEYKRLQNNPKIKIYPSLRFEYFQVLLKNAKFILGNSSSGIIEAPYYGVGTINIGTRQNNRARHKSIINVGYGKNEIIRAFELATANRAKTEFNHFGDGKSDRLFIKILNSGKLWKISKQKQFEDLTHQIKND